MKAPTNLSGRGSEQPKQSSLSGSSTTNEIWQGKKKINGEKKETKTNPLPACREVFWGLCIRRQKPLTLSSAWHYWEPKLWCRFPSAWVPVPDRLCFIPSEQQTTKQPSTGVTAVLEDPTIDFIFHLYTNARQGLHKQINWRMDWGEKITWQNTKHSFPLTSFSTQPMDDSLG